MITCSLNIYETTFLRFVFEGKCFITMLLLLEKVDIRVTQAEQFPVNVSGVSMVTVIVFFFCYICIIITNYLMSNSGCLA